MGRATLAALRNNGQEQMRPARRPAVERDGLAEDLRWAIARVVVHERADAGEDGAECAEPGARATGILIVAPSHRQRDPMAGRRHDRRGPDLHVELVHLPGLKRLLLV